MSAEVIDAHHHLWKYSQEEYPWMADGFDVIRRDFLLKELRQTLCDAGVDGAVAVQARQTLQETEWLLQLAGQSPLMRGVVGWVPLVNADVRLDIERFAANPRLKAVRHVLHDEAGDFYMLREDFNRGIALLPEFNLGYDLLIFEKHLPQTIEFVDRHPNQVFIVDHIAKPKLREKQISPWRENLVELARRPNVYCKLSGMVTEADWKSWNEHDLEPYFDVVLEAFGPERLMFGSDWPVILLACDYTRWVDVVKRAISKLTPTEQERILGGTAKAAYRL